MDPSIFDSGFELLKTKPSKKKRKTLTPAQRIFVWERPKLYGRKCSICHEKITKLSDLELDHTKAYSKGGTRLALSHKDCNRLKSSGSLGKIHRTLGIKSTKKKSPRKKTRPKGRYWINPLPGRRERLDDELLGEARKAKKLGVGSFRRSELYD
ncbi:TPA: HNH endonuclease [Candidatus Micrarchaeota archaeon]|nr:HNH endonuclease [Candidatus Micrarchaeota archaeon]